MPFLGWKQGFPIQNKEKKGKQKKIKKKKQIKKRKKKEKKQEKPKILKNEFFSYQSNFSFLGGCPKFPFFDNLAQKARTPKALQK